MRMAILEDSEGDPIVVCPTQVTLGKHPHQRDAWMVHTTSNPARPVSLGMDIKEAIEELNAALVETEVLDVYRNEILVAKKSSLTAMERFKDTAILEISNAGMNVLNDIKKWKEGDKS